MLPKTLSRDIVSAIGHGTVPDSLKSRPALLLKFFRQAVQSESWCIKSICVLIKTGSVIYSMACAGVLHWDEVSKTVSYVCEYYSKILFLPIPVTKDREFLIDSNQFTKLLLARDGLLFRNPTTHDFPLFTKIQGTDLEYLVCAIINSRYEQFYSLDLAKLSSYLRQFAEWKNQRGLDALQIVYSKRINDCRSAIMALFQAEWFDYPIIKERALEVIAATEFCETLDNGGDYCYTNLTVGSSFDEDNKQLSFEERKHKDKTVLSLNLRQEAHIQCIAYCEPENLVCFRVAGTADRIKEVRNIYTISKKICLPRNKTKRLRLSSKACVNADFLFGFLVYFNEVLSLELYDFDISKEFLEAISKIRNNLTHLRFQQVNNLNFEALNTLPEFLPELTSLYFSGLVLDQRLFEILKRLKKLDQLVLTQCTFSLPDDLSFFSQLLSFGITNVKKPLDFEKLWIACTKLEDLCVAGLVQFDPFSYPYKDKILNISVHAKECEKWIDEKGLVLEVLFPNLASIYIYGNTYSGRLVKAIEKISKNNQIKVELKEADDGTFHNIF